MSCAFTTTSPVYAWILALEDAEDKSIMDEGLKRGSGIDYWGIAEHKQRGEV